MTKTCNNIKPNKSPWKYFKKMVHREIVFICIHGSTGLSSLLPQAVTNTLLWSGFHFQYAMLILILLRYITKIWYTQNPSSKWKFINSSSKWKFWRQHQSQLIKKKLFRINSKTACGLGCCSFWIYSITWSWSVCSIMSQINNFKVIIPVLIWSYRNTYEYAVIFYFHFYVFSKRYL